MGGVGGGLGGGVGGGGERRWERGCFVMIVIFWTKAGGSLANLPSIQQKGCTYLGICNSN